MDKFVLALLGFGGLMLLAIVSARVRLVLALCRARLLPPDGEPWFDDVSPPEPPTACEAAGIAELEALGFERIAEWRDCRADEPVRTVFLAQADRRVFAVLPLIGSSLGGYMVRFHSFEQDARPFATVNRIGWWLAGTHDSSKALDARVDSLAEHLAVHRARSETACEVDPAEAVRRLRAQAVADGVDALASGIWVRGARGAHMSLKGAIRAMFALHRERAMLRRPYRSPVTSGELVPFYMVDLIGVHERAAARKKEGIGALKSLLLLVSLLAALWVWGIAFDWRTAVILVGVLLVHESGHAVAMRMFGWGDLHMFFIPLLGAVVTGTRPRDVPAWKDAIVMLAGPVPGLVLGLALLAHAQALPPLLQSVANMAVLVNAFNLLPLMPLDGGRLVEIALFSRWPRGRVVLLAASVAGLLACAISFQAPLIGALAALLLVSLRHQWRLAALERAVVERTAVAGDSLELRVARVVDERSHAPSLPMKLLMAIAVLARRRVHAARLVESVAIVAALVALWMLAAAPLKELLFSDGRLGHPARSTRTTVQRDFDRAWYDAGLEPTSPQWTALLAREAALGPGDPRHRDVEWLRIETGPLDQRQQAIDQWLKEPGEGYFETRRRVVWNEVGQRSDRAARLSHADRLAPMAATVAWVDALQPSPLAPAVDVRLRLAEAMDLAGDAAGADRLLDDATALIARVTHGDDPGAVVIQARAWRAIAQGHPDEALRLIDAAGPSVDDEPDDSLAVTRAWARLFAGQSEGAFIDMRAAMHADPHVPGQAPQRDGRFDVDNAMDLVVAEARAGHVDAARGLAQGTGRDGCESDAMSTIGETVYIGPWQVARMQERAKLARQWCRHLEPVRDAASQPAR